MGAEITYVQIKDVPNPGRGKWWKLVKDIPDGMTLMVSCDTHRIAQNRRNTIIISTRRERSGFSIVTRIRHVGDKWNVYIWRKLDPKPGHGAGHGG